MSQIQAQKIRPYHLLFRVRHRANPGDPVALLRDRVITATDGPLTWTCVAEGHTPEDPKLKVSPDVLEPDWLVVQIAAPANSSTDKLYKRYIEALGDDWEGEG